MSTCTHVCAVISCRAAVSDDSSEQSSWRTANVPNDGEQDKAAKGITSNSSVPPPPAAAQGALTMML